MNRICLTVKTCSIPFFIFHTHLKGLLPASQYVSHTFLETFYRPLDHPYFFTFRASGYPKITQDWLKAVETYIEKSS